MKKLFNLSFFYLILGLLLGVFFREFTKFNNFTDSTTLSTTHTHALVLGFIFFLTLVVIEKTLIFLIQSILTIGLLHII